MSARGLFNGLTIVTLLLPPLLSGSLAGTQAAEPLKTLKTDEVTDGLTQYADARGLIPPPLPQG